MYERRIHKPLSKSKALVTVLVLVSVGFLNACATNKNQNMKPIDKLTAGIEDKQMRQLWIQAHEEGRLPPIERIPVPDKRVAERRPAKPDKMPPSPTPVRPLIHESVIAEIQPFSPKALHQYKGDFQIVENKPGVLVGRIRDADSLLEFHYKLPTKYKRVPLRERTRLQLNFRDDVRDSALQRRIVLSDKGDIAPFLYIAEGSNEPFYAVVREVGLKIEQGKEIGNPPVKVTYKGDSVVLKQGQRKRMGRGDKAVEIFLRSSVAIDQKKEVLREGQPFYVNLVIYQTE